MLRLLILKGCPLVSADFPPSHDEVREGLIEHIEDALNFDMAVMHAMHARLPRHGNVRLRISVAGYAGLLAGPARRRLCEAGEVLRSWARLQ